MKLKSHPSPKILTKIFFILLLISTYFFFQNCSGAGGGSDGAGAPTTPGPQDSATLNSVIAISAGSDVACALITDGTIRCWAMNQSSSLGQAINPGMISAHQIAGITNAIGISVGNAVACAALADGQIKCFGFGGSGRLGNGSLSDSLTTGVFVSGISNATSKIHVGITSVCAILATGEVKCWGSGDLGDGAVSNANTCVVPGDCSATPVLVSGITNAIDISGGQYYSCALLATGATKCWGINSSGEFGNNSTTNSSVPVTTNFSSSIDLSTGQFHTCTLLANNSITCAGFNRNAQLGQLSNTGPSTCGGFACSPAPVTVSGITNAVAVQNGANHTCALLGTGEVSCFGYNESGEVGNGNSTGPDTCASAKCAFTPTIVSGITAVAIAASEGYSCALLTDSTVKCWGSFINVDKLFPETIPQIPGGFSGDFPVPAGSPFPAPENLIATGLPAKVRLSWSPVAGALSYKLRYSQGTALSPTYTEISSITSSQISNYELTTVTANLPYTFAVLAVLPGNTETQLSNEVTATPLEFFTITKVAPGTDHTCAILGDATVKCWGTNSTGQLGNGSTVATASTVTVPAISNAIDISSGNAFTCVIVGTTPSDTSGRVKCWGEGSLGQLGNGSSSDSSSPVDVNSITTASQISARSGHVCIVTTAGNVLCWGEGSSGQLGNNASNDSNIPITANTFGPDNYALTPATTKAFQVSVGDQHSCARVSTSNGSAGLGVKCWGATNHGELGNGAALCQVNVICDPKNPNPQPQSVTGISSAAFLAAGAHHTCVSLTNNTVRCWGEGSSGQLGNNATNHSAVPVTVSGLSSTSYISSGQSFSCGSSSGTLMCWGLNSGGQLGNGSTTNTKIPVVASSIAASSFDSATLMGGIARTCMKLTADNSTYCFP